MDLLGAFLLMVMLIVLQIVGAIVAFVVGLILSPLVAPFIFIREYVKYIKGQRMLTSFKGYIKDYKELKTILRKDKFTKKAVKHIKKFYKLYNKEKQISLFEAEMDRLGSKHKESSAQIEKANNSQ